MSDAMRDAPELQASASGRGASPRRVDGLEAAAEARRDLVRAVRRGLVARPKRLECRFFYDREGSRLFEAIGRLPEYYLTRAERSILRSHSREIAKRLPRVDTIVELGSGNASKTRLLLRAFLRRRPVAQGGGAPLRYVPIDLAAETLRSTARALERDLPDLDVVPIAAEYEEGLRRLRRLARRGSWLVLWLGSNVGNFDRSGAARFLRGVRALLAPDDRFLLGVDLRKSAAVLVPAYDDARGVTARFDLNLLARINRELGGRFDLAAFRHRARYLEGPGRIEMHLVSERDQRVPVAALGRSFEFRRGETVHTENSYKYSPAEIDGLARRSGFGVQRRWLDAGRRFALCMLAPRATRRRR